MRGIFLDAQFVETEEPVSKEPGYVEELSATERLLLSVREHLGEDASVHLSDDRIIITALTLYNWFLSLDGYVLENVTDDLTGLHHILNSYEKMSAKWAGRGNAHALREIVSLLRTTL